MKISVIYGRLYSRKKYEFHNNFSIVSANEDFEFCLKKLKKLLHYKFITIICDSNKYYA